MLDSTSTDRVAHTEARLAELEGRLARPPARQPFRRQLSIRLFVVGLALAVMLPAGAVLASHQFSDVPTSHQFHSSISAIADAGITSGCGGGRYCPDGLVTRGQMAAFLSRLGALAPGSAPKVNAAKLQGSLPAVATIRLHGSVTSTTPQVLDSFTVAVPGPGTLYVQVAGDFRHNIDAAGTPATSAFQWGICDTPATTCLGYDLTYTQDADTASPLDDTPGSLRARVVTASGAGPRTFYVNAQRGSAASDLETWNTYATVLFFPGAGTEMDINRGTVLGLAE